MGGTLSTPSASSPRPWMKMKVADLEISVGAEIGGMIMGGFLEGAMIFLCYIQTALKWKDDTR
jgi:hypothetical protein